VQISPPSQEPSQAKPRARILFNLAHDNEAW